MPRPPRFNNFWTDLELCIDECNCFPMPHLDTTLNVSPAMMSPSVPSASFTLKPS